MGGSVMAIDYRPFVFYGGNCRDAFTRYKEILGGDLVSRGLGRSEWAVLRDITC